MHMGKPFTLAVAFALAFSLANQGTAAASTTWFSGMRAFGQVTVEPAVDLATGNEVFLLTPNNVPAGPAHAAARAHAPLFLVLYPEASTLAASSFNCQPTNCDHAQTFPGYALKGHDHLVGVPHTGDFNVAWDVIAVAFTPHGFADQSIDTRILTLTQLDAAVASGDVVKIDIGFSFNCSITSITTYVKGTPLTFSVP
jgi:hypothetical protein